MATIKVDMPKGDWVKIMDASDTAFATLRGAGRIAWKRADAAPATDDDEYNTAGHQFQINGSATQQTWARTLGDADTFIIVNDD